MEAALAVVAMLPLAAIFSLAGIIPTFDERDLEVATRLETGRTTTLYVGVPWAEFRQ